MSNSFTKKAEEALSASQSIAQEYGHTYIGTEHLLLSLIASQGSSAGHILKRYDIKREKIEPYISDFRVTKRQAALTSHDTTPRLRRVIEESYTVARGLCADKIGTEHILISLLDDQESIAYKILTKLGVEPQILKSEAIDYTKSAEISIRGALLTVDEAQIPALTKYGKNMTKYARDKGYEPTVERDIETERVIRILTRKNKNNPCLIGEAGVGKTAIIEGLAMRIASGEVPDLLKNKTIISLDLTSMVAGAKYRGDFEDRIKSIVKEAKKFPSIILFIDEIHTIVGAGAAEGAIDAANILKPELARGDIKLIGATTISEYRKYIEKDAALERRFQSVLVEEPTKEQSIKILSSIKARYEEYHNTKIDDDAIERAVYLSSRFITDRFLPDKAIDLIDEACALVKSKESKLAKNANNGFQNKEKYDNFSEERALEVSEELIPRVSVEVIDGLVSEITGIDISNRLTPDISRLRESLSRRVVGQKEAIDALSRSLIKGMLGINERRKPKGVFLFLGESGVGKTELAKALSEELFSGEGALIRYDMTEFSEKGSISKIIGASPGYVGYDDTNSLLERIRLRPYTVVLLDEIEKAHPDVLALFLTIFDEGIITDSTGRKINFKNTYIIMTSNIGNDAHKLKAKSGFLCSEEKPRVEYALKEYFSEEFINRIDEIVVFNRLTLENLYEISRDASEKIISGLFRLGIKCEISDEVIMHLAKENKKTNLGARALLRKISDEIECGVASFILERNIGHEEIISVALRNDKVSFERKRALCTDNA